MILALCTNVSPGVACWVGIVIALMVGGFFGVAAMALVVAARDADEDSGRARSEADDDDDDTDHDEGKW